MRKILVLNLGSTSFKFKLYNMGGEETLLASGGVESIGTEGAYRIRANGREENARCRCQTRIAALEDALSHPEGVPDGQALSEAAREHAGLQQRLDGLMELWEQESSRLEQAIAEEAA